MTSIIEGNDAVTGQIISTTIGGKNGEPKQVTLCFPCIFVAVNRFKGLSCFFQKLSWKYAFSGPFAFAYCIGYSKAYWRIDHVIISFAASFFSNGPLFLKTISYKAERVVGTGSFGIVFQVYFTLVDIKYINFPDKWLTCSVCQAKCLETGETVAIKKVLQDRRYKNRELQLMRLMNHPNVISLKHCFFSTTSKDELFLNLVMEYVPENLYRVLKHYSSMNQTMPLIYVKLYTYQVWNFPNFHTALKVQLL